MDLQLLTLLPFRILLSQQQVTDVTRTWLHGLATAAVAQGRMLRVRASFILVLAAVLATGAWALTAEDSAGLTSLQQSLMNDQQAAAYKWTNGTDPCCQAMPANCLRFKAWRLQGRGEVSAPAALLQIAQASLPGCCRALLRWLAPAQYIVVSASRP